MKIENGGVGSSIYTSSSYGRAVTGEAWLARTWPSGRQRAGDYIVERGVPPLQYIVHIALYTQEFEFAGFFAPHQSYHSLMSFSFFFLYIMLVY